VLQLLPEIRDELRLLSEHHIRGQGGIMLALAEQLS